MTQNSSISHNVPLIGQSQPTRCWAACVAMLKGETEGAVVGRTPPDLILADGSLRNYSGQSDWLTGTRKFCAAHGLGFAPPMSWTVAALHSRLSRGPFMMDVLWNATRYTAGRASSGHMVVITGMSGSGPSTTLHVNNPLPVNRGQTEDVSYADLIRRLPAATYRIMWKL